ncbi:hypothetical protein OUZ56_003242 [Daphnia magna]|uniref:Uncharacterized protein n=1 Tax=Daphnia magna TaxID=35525 RepID=A0ABR0A8L0_9CRUS|nr:hypothetical protein OUZ56_003242 [Daphnia magna]
MTMVLEKLCDEVQLTSELLCHDKLKQHRKKDVQQKDSILFSLWARYMEHELSTIQLLEDIVQELKSTFPAHVTDHPFNNDVDDFNILIFEECYIDIQHSSCSICVDFINKFCTTTPKMFCLYSLKAHSTH